MEIMLNWLIMKSRMMGDCHVRFCESLGVKSPWATRHYTHLAKLAGRLSQGHIETSLLSLPRQGVVGKALKEVASYLKGLAKTADWIRDGRYGTLVKEKSEHDVLA
jgi:hypothetical protein